jgi:hypothetical protein
MKTEMCPEVFDEMQSSQDMKFHLESPRFELELRRKQMGESSAGAASI